MSVAFTIISGALGDAVIAKAVFDAIIELVPTCKIDVFCPNKFSESCAKAFYGGSKNLNRVLSHQEFYADNVKKYDAALRAWHMVLVNVINVERLQSAAPNLLQSLQGIVEYNKKYVYDIDVMGIVLRNMARARILGIDRYTCLSCGGALPIYDNRVEISLSPEGERAFRKLKLRKAYITIGSNLQNTERMTRHTLREWPAAYATEYITLINRHLPQIQVVQVGGGGCIKLANADVHLIDADLELVKHVLANSLLHVDCESGLVHLATQLGTKCLVLFEPTEWRHTGYAQNLNLVSDFCTPCYFAWDDGSKCLRGAKEPPCMLSHTPRQIFEVTRSWLEHSGLKNNA